MHVSIEHARRRLSAPLTALTLAGVAAAAVAGCGASGAAPNRAKGSTSTAAHRSTVARTGAAHSTVVARTARAAHHAASLKGLYGSLPTAGTPRHGGTITMGEIEGDTPTYIFPIIPGANGTDGTAFLTNQLWLPLYNLQVGGSMQVNFATSVALPPKFSDHDRRARIRLRQRARWSNGQPVSANDVLFDIALLKAAVKQSAANWESYVPGLIPDNIASARADGRRTVVLTFKRAYNPAFLLGNQLAYTLTPLPSAVWNVDRAGGPHLNWRVPANAGRIYSYLSKQGGSLATFASNPLWKVVDGPFTLGSFNTTNSSFTLDANPHYTLTGSVRYHALDVETYTSADAELAAMRTGGVDVGTLDFSALGEAGALRSAGYAVYGYPNIGSFGINLNFKDRTDHFGAVASQLYARQALAHLEDQPGYIKGFLRGAASTAYGPLPTIPHTPFTPADAGTDPYPYSITKAARLLRAHGWKVVPGGQSTCVRPGAGAHACGAGIPKGTPFKFTLYSVPSSATASIPLESEAFASAAKRVGIEVTLETKTFNFLISNFNDANPADKHFENTWGATNWGEFGTSPYPTEDNIFNTGGTENVGGYSNKTADRLIHAAIFGGRPATATRLASYLERDVPMLFLPCADVIDAVSNKVGGTHDSWLAMTQDVFYPQYWYLKR